MHEPYDFGIILRDLRKSKGYTQKRLADMLGLSVTAVSKYEINQSSPPLETLRAISNIFNVSIDELLGTEQRGKLSTTGLSEEQTDIVKKLIASFRNNSSKNKKLSPESCQLLGEIVEELSK
ncbi:MAG: helix-turn-helix transcriptional regulator [Ruminococcus sp.]|nr:helix-turn-helix transcriptional regulator [Ruminococcus sp.]